VGVGAQATKTAGCLRVRRRRLKQPLMLAASGGLDCISETRVWQIVPGLFAGARLLALNLVSDGLFS
jgi:hypothetical protein